MLVHVCVDEPAIVVGLRILRVKFNRPAVVSNGLFIFIQLTMNNPPIVVGCLILRVELNRPAEFGNSLLQVALIVVGKPPTVEPLQNNRITG
jgi:hypothetical protein